MRNPRRYTAPFAAALLAAFTAAQAAEDEEIAELTRPESTVRVGVGAVDEDNRRFGQFTGMTESGAYGLLDADIVRRDDSTGTWLRFTGRNLGLEHRGLRFEHERQGNWGYFIDFSQTPRIEPYVAFTNVVGIGTNNLIAPAVLTATPGGRFELGTRRDTLGAGFSKYLGGPWSTQVRFRHEEKDGSRIFARGTTGTLAAPFFANFGFAPEPISSTTRQLEALVNYTGERLQLSGGYYGTMYDNDYKGLFITGGIPALAAFSPISLPPDNESHQLHLNGGYQFTPATRATFRLARGRATQRDAFLTAAEVAPATILPTVPSHLDGRVDTTQAQLGLATSPLPKLSLRLNARYEDRDDRTPLFQFLPAAPTATHNGFNEPRSIRTGAGTLEASYLLPAAVRLTGGMDYEEKRRNTSPVRVVTFREKTEEISYRIGVRRAVAESLTGALTYVHSERDGSPFLVTTLNDGTVAASGNRVAPIHLADRDRDLVRVSAEWQATDALSLQLLAEHARDDYDPIHPLGIGPREGRAQHYSVDGALSLSEAWQVTAWASRSDNEFEQSQHVGSGTAGLLWEAFLRTTGNAFGLGLRGNPSGALSVGADLAYSELKDRFDQRRLNAVSPGTIVEPLPDIRTKLTRLQLFARYALRKNSGLRLDYVHDRFETDDWTWTNFQYTDGTILVQPPLQKVNFVGLSYYHRFQ